MRSVFFADAWCEYGFINSGPSEFIDYAMEALRGHAANQHMIGNVLIEVDGDEAFGEVYFTAYHKVQTEPADGGGGEDVYEDTVIAGRYLDRYEKRDGVWKFAYRSERVDWTRTQPTLDSFFAQAPDTLRGGRLDDAVYDKERRRKSGP